MATLDGARCLGLADQIGSLETGKKADIVLLDFDKPHLTPRHNVVSHLVYAAGASDVCATMVDGHWLFKNGEWLTLDVAEICATSEKMARELVAKAGGSKQKASGFRKAACFLLFPLRLAWSAHSRRVIAHGFAADIALA